MLSTRLKSLIQIIEQHAVGEEFYDIACDHCLVGEYFFNENRFSKVYCIDQSRKALEIAFERLKRNNLYSQIPDGFFYKNSALEINHEKGENLTLQKKSTLLLAGIGGHTLTRILDGLSGEKNFSHFVLSPHNDHVHVRRFLAQKGFGLIEESVVQDKEHFYEVYVVSMAERAPIHPYGSKIWQNPNNTSYLRYYVEKLSRYPNSSENALIIEYLKQFI